MKENVEFIHDWQGQTVGKMDVYYITDSFEHFIVDFVSLVLNHFDPTCVWQEVFNPDNLNNSIIGYNLAHVCLLKNK